MNSNKLPVVALIIGISIVIASVYGILHDQFTYTVSPEYYTKFKFIMFGLASDPEETMEYPRLAVTLTGIIATWWVGLIIGIVFGLVSLLHKDRKAMLRSSVKAILLAIAITTVSGFAGLGYGWFTRNTDGIELYYRYEYGAIKDIISFHITGCMHNFSYLGGAIGMLVGIMYIVKQSKKANLAGA